MARALQIRLDEVSSEARRAADLPGGGRDAGREATRTGERGFTLVELVVAVAIIGILSTLAVVGYRRIINSSKMAEANHMVGAIKVAQEQYRSETGSYLDLSTALAVNSSSNAGNCYPPGTPTSTSKVAWGGWDCGSRCKNSQQWTTLNVHADGAVQWGYTTIAGAAGQDVPSAAALTIAGNSVTWPTGATINAAPWFIVAALGDTDGNGVYATVVGTSWQSGLMVDKEGE